MNKIKRKVTRNLIIVILLLLILVTAFINYFGENSDMLYLRNNILFWGSNRYEFNIYCTKKKNFLGFGEEKLPQIKLKFEYKNSEGNKSYSYDIKELSMSKVVFGKNLFIDLTGEYYYSLYLEVIKNGNKVYSETLNTDGAISYSDY